MQILESAFKIFVLSILSGFSTQFLPCYLNEKIKLQILEHASNPGSALLI